MRFEDLLEVIGEFDAYQWQLLFIIVFITLMPNEWAAINFIAWPVQHWCRVDELQVLPLAMQRDLAGPLDDATGTTSQCKMWNINYTEALENLRDATNISWCTYSNSSNISPCDSGLGNDTLLLWKQIVADSSWTLCDSWVYNVSFLHRSIRSSWDLVCHREWLVEISSTFVMAGLLIGSLISGRVSDRLGRLKAIWIFHILKTIGGIVAALAPDVWVFLLGRFLLATGGMANHLARYVLLVELIGTRWRLTVAILYSSTGIISTLSLVGLAYILLDYMYLQIAMCIPMLLAFIAYPFLYESPRWLIVQGRYAEAEQIIHRISRMNKKPLPAGLNVSEIDVRDSKCQARLRDLLHYPVLRKRTLIISFHWLADSLLYYALIFNIGSLPGNAYVNMLIVGLIDLPVCILSWGLLRWRVTGRRLTCAFLLIMVGLLGIVEVPFTLLEYSSLLTVLSLICMLLVSTSFTSIYIYSAELYPTQARNTGMGFSSTCARAGSLVAPFVGPWLAGFWKPLPSVVFAVVGSTSGLLTLLLPETLGQKLPETLQDAEHFKSGNLLTTKVYQMKEDLQRNGHSAPLLDDKDLNDVSDEDEESDINNDDTLFNINNVAYISSDEL